MREYYSESYKSRKSRGATLKSLQGLTHLEGRIDSALLALNKYADGNTDLDIVHSQVMLHSFGYPNLSKGALQVLSGEKEWMASNYRVYCSYLQEAIKQQYVWHDFVHFHAEEVHSLQRILSGQSGLLLGFSSLYSSMETFNQLHLVILNAYDKYFMVVKTERKYGAQTFMVQLATDYLGLPQRDWSGYFGGEPLFDEILTHWKDEDVTVLNGLLIQLCNRHTHHTRASTAKNNHDFDHLALYHFPVEVLMVYRLRQWKGLSLPQVKHPLMKAPFDQLPEIQEGYSDELLEKVKIRARCEYPNFERVIAQGIEQAKQWQPTDVNPEKEVKSRQVDIKQQLLDTWLANRVTFAPLQDGQKVTLEMANGLIQSGETKEIGVLLSHSRQGYKHLKTTPVANFVSLPNTDEIWHPAALLQDWSILRDWAMDMADDLDEIQNFIERRLDLLHIPVPSLIGISDVMDKWNREGGSSPYDLFDAQVAAANQTLESLGYCLVSMDLGRDEYVIYLVSLDQKKILKSSTSISGIEVNIEK